MTLEAAARTPSPPARLRPPLFLRFALRELRTGLSGFYVFVACIALGVGAIAGVGSLAGALKAGLEQQGREILGGDVAVNLIHRRTSTAERQFLEAQGAVSEIATLRAMARQPQGKGTSLVQVKAVDAAYPLFGAVGLSTADGTPVPVAQLQEPGTAAVAPLLLARLDLQLGDLVRIGSQDIRIVAHVDQEPDALSGRAAFGPRVLMSLATLEATGLVQPGSLIRWRYRLRLADASATDATGLKAFRDGLQQRFPQAGLSVRDRRDPSPNVTRAIDRFSQFLTLIGITTLLIGGVGVANAIATYVARKRKAVAIFKCLGASANTIFATYFTQIMILACVGTAIGLILGAALPALVAALYGGSLPVTVSLAPRPGALALATLYGLLTALVFVVWPLGAARDLRPALLLRQTVSGESARPRGLYLGVVLLSGLALFAIAIASSEARFLAFYASLGLVALFLFYLGLGVLVERLARRLRRPKRPELALALSSLAAPGGLARSVTLSLGTSLSLLVAVSLVNTSLIGEFNTALPKNAPTYFMLDIDKGDIADFRNLIRERAPETEVETAPMLRGRIVSLKGVPAAEIKPSPDAAWVLNGDRGLTYAETLPDNSKMVAGTWWPKDYDGPPLVSFAAEVAEGLGLEVGDKIAVNILGRNVEARIANLRTVDWETLAINFVMVFSPNTLAKAPFNLLATLKLPDATDTAAEGRLIQTVSERFPAITAIRVRDALNAIQGVVTRVMTAIQAAGSLTLLVGAIVVAGALATAHRRRTRDAVIFKTLGATRRRIITAHTTEYLVLALITGLAALMLGTLAAFLVVTLALDAPFTFSLWAVLQAVGLATALVVVFGAVGTWRVLSTRPVPLLRAD